MSAVFWLIIVSSMFHVFGVSRNEAGVLQLLPGAKIRVLERTRLVVNCTSHSEETPRKMQWTASRVNKHMSSEVLDNRTVALVIEELHKSDAGFYTCYLFLSRGRKFEKTVHVSVKPRYPVGSKNTCASTQFRCKNGLCIFLQYRCDNRDDCGDKSDEQGCSGVPCGNKFLCGNNRCISYDLVCDEFHNDDCGDMSDEICTEETAVEEMNPAQSSATNHPRQTSVDDQMRWLKTTVYSVIGCTVGVVLFIAILVIAIFRIKMKRAAARRQMFFIERRRRELMSEQRPYGLQSEMDPFLAARSRTSRLHSNIILNVNNGVQYVPGLEFTSLMEAPPPYSDTCSELTPVRRDSPPPPYSTIDRRVTERNRTMGDNPCEPSTVPVTDSQIGSPPQAGLLPVVTNTDVSSNFAQQTTTGEPVIVDNSQAEGCSSAVHQSVSVSESPGHMSLSQDSLRQTDMSRTS